MDLSNRPGGKLDTLLHIEAVSDGVVKKYCLIVLDKNTGLPFLVDTGADISLGKQPINLIVKRRISCSTPRIIR